VLMIAVCTAWDETAFSTCHLIINFLVEQVSCPLLLVMCLAVVEASQIVSFWFADVVLVKTCSAVRALATLFSAKAFFGHLCLWSSLFPTLQLFAVLSSQSSLVGLPCRDAEAFWGFAIAILKLKSTCMHSLSSASTEK
jgi:hypothetical protein